MKFKYNVQRLIEIKDKVISKVRERKKVPANYYALLGAMIIVLIIATVLNVKKLNSLNKEDYYTYSLEVNNNDENEIKTKTYETAVSSISTDISNYKEEKEISENIQDNSNEFVDKIGYVMPVNGEITKEYAADKVIYSKTLDMWRTHLGIDISADIGESVVSVETGKVIDVYKNTIFGNTVEVQHEDGYVSIYANLDENIIVKKGDSVKKSQAIGKIGTSAAGESKDASHLHFEMMKDGENVDPLSKVK